MTEVITNTIGAAAGGAALTALFSINDFVIVVGASIAALIGLVCSLRRNSI